MLKTFTVSLFLAAASFGQVVTWAPLFPTRFDTVTIWFNAQEGSRGLVNAGEVYVHTGVITNLSSTPSAWRYVKTSWGVNTAETRMEKVGTDLWKIRFHIQSYYNVPLSETILQLAFVFRNAAATRTGKTAENGDIFTPVYQPGLNLVRIEPPDSLSFADQGDSVKIRIIKQNGDSLTLWREDQRLAATIADTLVWKYAVQDIGAQRLTARVRNSAGDRKTLAFEIIVNPSMTFLDLPPGVRDGINCIDDHSVVLSLMAPHKSFCYVIGEFNDWRLLPAYFMHRTPDSSRFWLPLQDLEAGQQYAFQYLVDGHLRIADPYTRLVLDPWNDAAISDRVFSNLKPYPKDKAREIVSTLTTNPPSYDWNDATFVRPAKQELVIYELLLRDFLDEHTFAGLTDSLAYFHRLGINALEIMPFNEFEGNDSWGYNPSFNFAPDKYYGDEAQLKGFIDAAHRSGLAVIQDIVLNHAYGQCPLVRLYADQMELNPWFNKKSPNPVYSWGYDFNHLSPATEAFVDRVLEYWLREFHVDGFRLDFTKGFTNTPGDGSGYDPARIRILKRIADKIWSVDSSAYVILEHFAPNQEEKELADYGMMLWGNCNYNYNEATMGYHDQGKSDFSWIAHKTRGWSKPHVVGYMESHDEERLMYKNLQYGNSQGDYRITDLSTALQRIQLAAAFFLIIPGPKMIWQFGELGYDYTIEYNGRLGRKPIRWDYYQDPQRRAIYDVMAALNRLRATYRVFHSNDFQLDLGSGMKRIHLQDSLTQVVVLGNFNVFANYVNPLFQKTGRWYDVFNRDSLEVTSIHQPIFLRAGEFRLYMDQRPDFANLPTAVEIQPVPQNPILLSAYPNPFNSTTVLRLQIDRPMRVKLDILNLQGRLVKTVWQGWKQDGIHEFRWDGTAENGQRVAGALYFYRLQTADRIVHGKMTLLR